MIQDLHAHTYYSFCGRDNPEAVVEAAIAAGISLLGFNDHNYGVGIVDLETFKKSKITGYGRCLKRYFDHITAIKKLYAGKIEILRGIELCTLKEGNYRFPSEEDISFFDYCLIENLDDPDSFLEGDIFSYAERCGCKTGIAHTDLFGFLKSKGWDAETYFSNMAQKGIFWELNVNYDSTHKFREHAYVEAFFASREQQEIILKTGAEVSVGFDGHKVEDYCGSRVVDYCRRLERLGIKQPFVKK